ncbi:MAG: hypothetical protein ABIK89_21880 [Planctomycetota bacterium]
MPAITVSGGYYVNDRPDMWDGTQDKLVEFRMCVLAREKAAGAHSAAEIWIGGPKPNTSCQLFLREDAMASDASYSPAYRIDATKTHTYRILFGDSSIGSPAIAGTSQWEFVGWSEVSAE